VTTVTIPTDGVPASFTFEVPAPGDLTTLGGIRLYFVFSGQVPNPFVPGLTLEGTPYDASQTASGPTSRTFAAQFPEALSAPQEAVLTVNEGSVLQAGSTVTIYAWGAQTESGTGALNPDEGGEPSIMTDTIEVGTVQVVTWQEWNRMTGANEGYGS